MSTLEERCISTLTHLRDRGREEVSCHLIGLSMDGERPKHPTMHRTLRRLCKAGRVVERRAKPPEWGRCRWTYRLADAP